MNYKVLIDVFCILLGVINFFLVAGIHFHHKRLERDGIETEATIISLEEFHDYEKSDMVVFGYTADGTYYEDKHMRPGFLKVGDKFKILYEEHNPENYVYVKHTGKWQLLGEILWALASIAAILVGIMRSFSN